MTLGDIHAIIFQDIFLTLKASYKPCFYNMLLTIEQIVFLKSWNGRYGDNIVKFSVLTGCIATSFH